MNDEETLRRHLGKSIYYEVTNEEGTTDKIEIKSLKLKDFPQFLSIMKAVGESGMSEESNETDFYKLLTPETIETITTIIQKTLRRTFKEIDEEVLDDFIKEHYFELMAKVFEVNIPKVTDESGDAKMKAKMNKIRRMKVGK